MCGGTVFRDSPTRFRRMARVRLDTLLAERGLFVAHARGRVGDGRRGAARRRAAGAPRSPASSSRRRRRRRRRGRASSRAAGCKLANALDAFGLDVAGRRGLDVGASTGGFTDCLLQRGAAHVVAVDVAYGELAWSLRNDERVTVLERVERARARRRRDLPYAPDLLVADVSFISLTKVLPAVLGVHGAARSTGS